VHHIHRHQQDEDAPTHAKRVDTETKALEDAIANPGGNDEDDSHSQGCNQSGVASLARFLIRSQVQKDGDSADGIEDGEKTSDDNGVLASVHERVSLQRRPEREIHTLPGLFLRNERQK
jgi:hypothetical protein